MLLEISWDRLITKKKKMNNINGVRLLLRDAVEVFRVE